MLQLRQYTDNKDAAERFDAETERLHQLALAGDRGVEAQLVAMSEQYKALKAAGKLAEAAAVKAAAIAIDAVRGR